MAYADWNLGGISARVWYRLQNNPKYTSSMRQAAIKKAVVRLLGYYDESHLTRDFQKFFQRTPQGFSPRRKTVAGTSPATGVEGRSSVRQGPPAC